MAIQLNETELRVLGVLIEKSLTQPDSYPLTLNAIVAGANQKQNREPVRDHTEAEVSRAVYTLEQKNLVGQAPPSAGARANRFLHNVVDRFHWDRREQAVMAELMLRGRQTAGELRTRGSRMTPIPDLEAITVILRTLKEADPPFVEELPREPGRSVNRVRHLLGTEDVEPAAVSPQVAPDSSIAAPDLSIAARLANLEAKVEKLSEEMAALKGPPHDRFDKAPADDV